MQSKLINPWLLYWIGICSFDKIILFNDNHVLNIYILMKVLVLVNSMNIGILERQIHRKNLKTLLELHLWEILM